MIAAVLCPITPACASDFTHWRKQAKSAKKLEDRMTALKQMAAWTVSEEGTSAKEVASGVAIGLSDKRIEARVYAARLLGLVEDKETALAALAKAIRVGSSELKKAQKKVAKRQRLFFKFLARVLPESAPLASSSYIDLAMLRDNIKHLRVTKHMTQDAITRDNSTYIMNESQIKSRLSHSQNNRYESILVKAYNRSWIVI